MKALHKSGQNRAGRNSGWAPLALLILAVVLAMPLAAPPAAAQEPLPRRNLFDYLFGGPRYERDDRYERAPPYSRRRYDRDGSIIEMSPRPRNRSPGRAAAPRPVQPVAPPAPEPVAKLGNAKQILVVGDFMAGGIGSELETAFVTSPGVVITERSDGSSGLVREDHFDWPAELPVMLDEVKPAVVVVMLGANDRQQMTIGGSIKEKFRSDAWFKEYERRVTELVGIVTTRKLPLLWVGLPSFQSPVATADAVTLNAIYRNQVEKAGGEFVDIWEGFVDEDGKFVVTGSDVNGQQVRLRGSDGITFTKAGKQKLAFYVEKLVRRHLGEMASPDVVKLDGSNLPALSALPASPGQSVPTHPISLSDPELDGGKDLLGAGPLPSVLVETPRDKLVRRGELAPAPAGRIDDYRVPAVSAATR
ncbi:protein of unknown function DUF459 [Rhizobium sp. CF080]|uniref:SGNH/GDSL hydrolase family protein n=1 Tax=Rhizobium sp. (strain CF080) TaxID=1144310 RepID=UPI0003E7E667|nr:DUF459 domain-containing protein [Rhizobium sp. CF080]EUB97110.1 protein of unknown function DUF459 [Rhizobium sp. CF080]